MTRSKYESKGKAGAKRSMDGVAYVAVFAVGW